MAERVSAQCFIQLSSEFMISRNVAKSVARLVLIVGILCATNVSETFAVPTWSSSQSYAGFGDTSDLEWRGVTNVSTYVPGNSFLQLSFGKWRPLDLWSHDPIRLLSSQRLYSVVNNAYVGEEGHERVHANDEMGTTVRTNPGHDAQQNARFAEVVSEQDRELLSRGNAIAEVDSDIQDNSFFSRGRFSTGTFMEWTLTERSYAQSEADASFSATYRVNEPLNYSLSATLGGSGDVDLGFRMTDDDGNDIALVEYSDGLSREIQICGTLLPGEYDFSLTATSISRMRGQVVESRGGEGVFDVNFKTFAIGSFAFDPAMHDVAAVANSEPTLHSVPESASDTTLLLAGVGLLGLRRRRER